MNIVSKQQFKDMYFKYGRARDGWSKDYWDRFYENDKFKNMKYLIDQPQSDHHYSIMIVDDFARHEYRMHLLSEDELN